MTVSQDIRHRLVDIIEEYGYEAVLHEFMWLVHDKLEDTPDADYALNSIGEAKRMLQRNQ